MGVNEKANLVSRIFVTTRQFSEASTFNLNRECCVALYNILSLEHNSKKLSTVVHGRLHGRLLRHKLNYFSFAEVFENNLALLSKILKIQIARIWNLILA
jgi:hypothetical protein